jgi:hypothetical protein
MGKFLFFETQMWGTGNGLARKKTRFRSEPDDQHAEDGDCCQRNGPAERANRRQGDIEGSEQVVASPATVVAQQVARKKIALNLPPAYDDIEVVMAARATDAMGHFAEPGDRPALKTLVDVEHEISSERRLPGGTR